MARDRAQRPPDAGAFATLLRGSAEAVAEQQAT
jgi:hypothetical protein